MEVIKENIRKLLKNGGGKKLIIICGIVGMLLILFSSLSDLQPESKDIVNYSVNDYKISIQEELKDILSKIQGVGDVEVLLTIENSVEGVYLENNSTKTKEIEPKIRGVVVACEGGDEPLVVQRIFEAVTKGLNISNAKVCVTKLSE